MKYAVHKWLKKTFDADSAPRQGVYHCPVCSAPVTLRAGSERVAYFAHKQGMGTRNCELFHPGASVAHAHPLNHDLSNGKLELKLGIQIAAGGHPRGWGLDLSLVTRDAGYAQICIDVGGRTQRMELRGESGKSTRVTAEPQSKPYSIISISPEQGVIADLLVRTCSSLSEEKITVFGDASKRFGVSIPLASEINFSGRYIFVWSANLPISFPSEICIECLQNNNEWRAGILDISAELSEKCQSWLKENTGLKLISAVPCFIPVWPPMVRRAGPRLSYAIRGGTVYLHSKGFLSSTALIYARTNNGDVAEKIDTVRTPFLRVHPESENVLQVSCRDNPELHIELDFNIDPGQSATVPSVTLTGEAISGMSTHVRLHDEHALEWIQRIASRQITLISLSVPSALSGVLRTGKSGVWTTEFNIFGNDGNRGMSGFDLVTDHIPEIVAALQNLQMDTQIDFGGFGRVTILAANPSSSIDFVQLKPALRARLKAYLTQLPRPKSQRHFDTRVTDLQLIEHVNSAQPTRETLAMQRSLLSELILFTGIKKGTRWM